MLKISNLWALLIGSAILGYCLFVFNQLSNRANNAEIALSDYKQAQFELTLKQQSENAIKLVNAQNAVNVEKEKSLKLLQDLQINRKETAIKLKAQYENKITTIERNLATRNIIMLSTANRNTGTSIKASSNTSKFAKSESDCHAAIARVQSQYSTLEDACVITTQDYNQLRAWGDTICKLAVCE